MGRGIARELLETTTAHVSIYDISPEAARRLQIDLASGGAGWRVRCSIVEQHDIAVSLTTANGIVLCAPWQQTRTWLDRLLTPPPSRVPLSVIVSIVRPDYADLNWLKSRAEQSGRSVLLPIGLEPGLVELIAVTIQRAISDLSELRIYCGGIPASPKLPLAHSLYFGERLATDDRDAWYVHRARPSLTSRFEDVRRIAIDGIGVLEAYHDGMMPTTAHDPRFSRLARFEQRTVRWPGFVERILCLRELGFFSDQEIQLGNSTIRPSDFSHRIMCSDLAPQELHDDLTVIHVVARHSDGAEGTLLLTCHGNAEASSVSTLTGIAAVAGLRSSVCTQEAGWHLPTSRLALECMPLLLERLRSRERIVIRASGILATFFSWIG